jgi:hypothetical protein
MTGKAVKEPAPIWSDILLLFLKGENANKNVSGKSFSTWWSSQQ